MLALCCPVSEVVFIVQQLSNELHFPAVSLDASRGQQPEQLRKVSHSVFHALILAKKWALGYTSTKSPLLFT